MLAQVGHEPKDPVRLIHTNEVGTLSLVVHQVSEGRHESLVGEANDGHHDVVEVRVHFGGLVVPNGLGDILDGAGNMEKAWSSSS